MAKRSAAHLAPYQFRPAAPAAIVVRRTTVVKKAKAKRRSHRRSGGFGGGMQGLMGHAMGGALFGFAVKSGYVDKLPAVPLIGRTGLAAFILDYFSRHGGGEMAGKAARAAAVMAGYQLTREGHVTGELQTTGDSYADGDDE